MLTKRLREQIEWHFKNYNADIALYNEKVRDILESGLTPNYGGVRGGGNSISSPTEAKAIKLYELDAERSWATVVRNTFIAFRFEPEYKVMCELYIKGRKLKELLCDGLWETTFYRWRNSRSSRCIQLYKCNGAVWRYDPNGYKYIRTERLLFGRNKRRLRFYRRNA